MSQWDTVFHQWGMLTQLFGNSLKNISLIGIFPTAFKQSKIQEFFDLEQGKMTVAKYVAKLKELGRFPASLMADEDMKATRFR